MRPIQSNSNIFSSPHTDDLESNAERPSTSRRGPSESTSNQPAQNTRRRSGAREEQRNINLGHSRQVAATPQNRPATRSRAHLLQQIAARNAELNLATQESHSDLRLHTPSPQPAAEIIPPGAPLPQRTMPIEVFLPSQPESDEDISEEAEAGAWQMRAAPPGLPAPNRSIFQSMLVALPEFGNHVMARLSNQGLAAPARTGSPSIGWWTGRPLADAVNDWESISEDGGQTTLDLDKWREIEQHSERNNCRSFSIFLDRLRETKEYKNESTRPFLAQRVQELLELLQQDDAEELRSLYFQLSPDAISFCGDRVALKFDDMELAALSHQAEKGKYSTTELKTIGLQMFQLECLKLIAREKSLAIAHSEGRTEYGEALEVELAYRVMLSAEPELDLPIRSKSMLYEWCARLTTEDIKSAKSRILEASKNKNQTTQFLIHWMPWAKQLERHYPQEFSTTKTHIQTEQDKIFEDLEQLEERRDRNEISHAHYQIEADALQTRYSKIDTDEMDQLKIRLTNFFH